MEQREVATRLAGLSGQDRYDELDRILEEDPDAYARWLQSPYEPETKTPTEGIVLVIGFVVVILLITFT